MPYTIVTGSTVYPTQVSYQLITLTNNIVLSWPSSFIGGTVAAGTGAVGIYYKGIFKQVIGKWDLQFAASMKAPKFVLNYYVLFFVDVFL